MFSLLLCDNKEGIPSIKRLNIQDMSQSHIVNVRNTTDCLQIENMQETIPLGGIFHYTFRLNCVVDQNCFIRHLGNACIIYKEFNYYEFR